LNIIQQKGSLRRLFAVSLVLVARLGGSGDSWIERWQKDLGNSAPSTTRNEIDKCWDLG